jgi:hypothetical protein
MSIKGHGLDFAGGANLLITLTNGSTIQGTFLGVFNQDSSNPCFPQPPFPGNPLLPLIGNPLSPLIGNPYYKNNDEFILLQLTCTYNGFLPGNLVAINVANIATIGPNTVGCPL